MQDFVVRALLGRYSGATLGVFVSKIGSRLEPGARNGASAYIEWFGMI